MNHTDADVQKIISNRATSLTLVFYEVALLAYSVYTYFTKGELGATFIIFMIGLIIYFVSNFIYNRKFNKSS